MDNRIYLGQYYRVQSAIIDHHNLPVAYLLGSSCTALSKLTHKEIESNFSTGANRNAPCAPVTSTNTIKSSVKIETLAHSQCSHRPTFPNQVDFNLHVSSDKFQPTLAISYNVIGQVHACILLISKYALDSLSALSNFRLASASLTCCRTPGPYVLLKLWAISSVAACWSYLSLRSASFLASSFLLWMRYRAAAWRWSSFCRIICSSDLIWDPDLRLCICSLYVWLWIVWTHCSCLCLASVTLFLYLFIQYFKHELLEPLTLCSTHAVAVASLPWSLPCMPQGEYI